ncbi:hypothetical protein ACE41H_15195 [Paenibacillus enshidis]|uniref:Uncharacterized protein n=1 Tax=Paenibacillus enshidis TaxID=1458439 RepID=A0ABV5AV70_9BACL
MEFEDNYTYPAFCDGKMREFYIHEHDDDEYRIEWFDNDQEEWVHVDQLMGWYAGAIKMRSAANGQQDN